jgi:hypothetical protein
VSDALQKEADEENAMIRFTRQLMLTTGFFFFRAIRIHRPQLQSNIASEHC